MQAFDRTPLLLDDLLVSFDDEAVQAALKVPSRLAEATQVLFFTHHPHIVELAQETLGDRVRAQSIEDAWTATG